MKLLVPILAVVLGIAFAVALALHNNGPAASTAPLATAESPAESMESATPDTPAAPVPDPAAAAPPVVAASDSDSELSSSESDPAAESNSDSPADDAPRPTIPGLRAVSVDSPLAPALGSDDPASDFELEVQFTSYGAGIQRITLAYYAQFVDPPTEGHPRAAYHLIDVTNGLAMGKSPAFYPYAARAVTLNGTRVALDSVRWAADIPATTGPQASVTYRVALEDEQGNAVAEVVRTWSIAAGSYDLQLDQRVVNRTGEPLNISFEQYGQGDVLLDLGNYLGDRRMFITGHFRPEKPDKFAIYVDNSFVPRKDLLNQKRTLWPNEKLKAGADLAWLAAENRYFAIITHAPVAASAQATADVPALTSVFPQVGYRVLPRQVDVEQADAQVVAVTLQTSQQTVEAGQTLQADLAVFAGPRNAKLMAEAPYNLLHFEKLIRYELGCTWCTFQWLAHLLLDYLKALHWLVRDWGVAIIILVLTVRLILHPITKRAQTNMMKMSKQMGSLQPEVAKLKEKYKDDSASLNREMMALYREKGINPANMLGCAPMLLQTPIWIALYAMLYFAIELRHEPAFYGIFQTISGGSWHFLQDLSVSDNFLRFVPPEEPAKRLNLIFIHPEFRSLNILPLLMAVVFYFQMKLTTPPPQNDQQKQQQAIMKFMPFIFPVMLYSAPAGLTLYICCSTLAGIVDSYLVRKHVREQEEAGTLFTKKEVKPGSLRDRLGKRMELAQQLAAEKQAAMKRKGESGASGGRDYKKRK